MSPSSSEFLPPGGGGGANQSANLKKMHRCTEKVDSFMLNNCISDGKGKKKTKPTIARPRLRPKTITKQQMK